MGMQVHVFDVSENLIAPLCSQKVARKGRLNRVAFNPRHPILITGDDRCCSSSALTRHDLMLMLVSHPV